MSEVINTRSGNLDRRYAVLKTSCDSPPLLVSTRYFLDKSRASRRLRAGTRYRSMLGWSEADALIGGDRIDARNAQRSLDEADRVIGKRAASVLRAWLSGAATLEQLDHKHGFSVRGASGVIDNALDELADHYGFE